MLTAVPVKIPPMNMREPAKRAADRLKQFESTNEAHDKPNGANVIPVLVFQIGTWIA